MNDLQQRLYAETKGSLNTEDARQELRSLILSMDDITANRTLHRPESKDELVRSARAIARIPKKKKNVQRSKKSKKDDCPLCDLKIEAFAFQYDSSDGKFSVAQCVDCGKPEAIWKEHGGKVGKKEADDLLAVVADFADQAFGSGLWLPDSGHGDPFDHLTMSAKPMKKKNPCGPCALALWLNPIPEGH